LKELYETITQALVTDGYVVIENALDTDLAKELLNFAINKTNYKQAGISIDSKLDQNKRKDKIHWLYEDNSIQSKFLEFSKSLQTYLNKELYLGLSYYESHFALYDNGDFYEKHLDAFKNSKNRVVTTVFYLNDDWKKEDGGELIIYDKYDKYLTKVTPKLNTLVVFMSEEFPHEVLKSNKKRYSIAGWFRVDKKEL